MAALVNYIPIFGFSLLLCYLSCSGCYPAHSDDVVDGRGKTVSAIHSFQGDRDITHRHPSLRHHYHPDACLARCVHLPGSNISQPTPPLTDAFKTLQADAAVFSGDSVSYSREALCETDQGKCWLEEDHFSILICGKVSFKSKQKPV
ncbi:unnamed protein product [Protopolystoma xenopodis]|uniref:Uncharacterized protein n=1 Tax=Protopolystoma xenopodis TaxID=117903 RepID=A0A3S5CCT3_9PLAT|nr:unnamed protein product [Protopolystoma xenopodis]